MLVYAQEDAEFGTPRTVAPFLPALAHLSAALLLHRGRDRARTLHAILPTGPRSQVPGCCHPCELPSVLNTYVARIPTGRACAHKTRISNIDSCGGPVVVVARASATRRVTDPPETVLSRLAITYRKQGGGGHGSRRDRRRAPQRDRHRG